jgi:hypothetical protein
MATAAVVPFVRPEGKGRQPAVVERLRDAEDEIAALTAERAAIGSEAQALSRRIELAIRSERPDVALHVAGRLWLLGQSLLRRGGAA